MIQALPALAAALAMAHALRGAGAGAWRLVPQSSDGTPVIHDELLAILACPETKQPLALADDALVEKLNAAIAGGALQDVGGGAVTEPVEGALLREDGEVLYLVRHKIPICMVDNGVRTADL